MDVFIALLSTANMDVKVDNVSLNLNKAAAVDTKINVYKTGSVQQLEEQIIYAMEEDCIKVIRINVGKDE